ncbi:hypothetical protein JHK82_050314 [Glycine max]|nr:hypothetical protein JHK82_050314 [Glycine max]
MAHVQESRCASGILLNHCAHWESYRDIMQTLCTSGILPRHCATTMRVKNPVGSLCTSRILLEHCVNIVHIKSPAGSSCQHCAQLESCRDIVQTLYASGILPDYYKQSRVGYSCSGFHAVMELTSFAALLLLSSCHYGSYFLLHLHVFLHKIEVPE